MTRASHEMGISEEDIGRPVVVHWLDIVQKTVHAPDPLAVAVCRSWGLVDRYDCETLTIITETMDEDCTKQSFPLGCVTRVEVL